MRKFIIILLLLIGLGIVLLYLNEKSFSSLKDKDFQKLFYNYNGSTEKICDVDFLGKNFKSEWFEAYLYKVDAVPVNSNYPDYKGIWEQKEITDEVITSKWRSCPLDSVTNKLYEFTLTVENFDEKECIKSFNTELNNPNNYYSHIYFNELEQYFILYCPDIGNLYYIRRKGF
jgi:hypothetical protein